MSDPQPLGHHLPPITLPPPTGNTAVLRQPAPPSARVVPVGVTSGLAGVVDAPEDVPLVLVKGTDGILRPQPANYAPPRWDAADDVRLRAGAPTDQAPVGAVHVDLNNGQIYRNEA